MNEHITASASMAKLARDLTDGDGVENFKLSHARNYR